jgi:hypothetical protein
MQFYKTPELNELVNDITTKNLELGERVTKASEDDRALIYRKYQLRRKCLREIWRFVNCHTVE